MAICLAVCKKENIKDVLKDPTKVPEKSVTSNVPEDKTNPPSNINTPEGFKTPVKTPNNENPKVTIDVSKVSLRSLHLLVTIICQLFIR